RKIDSIIFPGIQGGPLMHVIAAKAVGLKEAMSERFKIYQKQVIDNAKALAQSLNKSGYRIVAGGTDTHLLLVNLSNKNITGKDASSWQDKARITANKNLVPFDKESPAVTSGLRLGTPAVTTRGMKTKQMEIIASLIDRVVSSANKEAEVKSVVGEVDKLTEEFPLYPQLWKE
ncbi:MAG: serine hydroxymethyltransferase, partial [Candidatus Omnitrophica bacterium]|nr:serine hydroxymethyltransferase [Candidatus Omnitrophota bacterium]